MSSGNNHIELRDHDDVLFEGDLSYYLPDDPDAHELSRRRWRGDEPDHALTFGAILSGDTLWDAYQTAHRFTSDDTILEIGPGYGRLLKTALDRRVPFRSYMGIDLSEARISRLAAKFTEPRCGFAQGDAESWRGSERFSVVICSSTFEHFHPDCRAVLHNIRQQLREGATVLLDFPGKDHPFSGVDGSGAYVRCYPKAELRDVFAECGYSVSEITECSIGNDHLGRPVDRFVVIATPRHALPRTVAKTS
jgi:SAM-dependent methyltransferase